VGDFHEFVGDLTREQLNNDPYQCGARVGKAARERDPRSWPRKLASSVGIRSLSCARRSMSAARLGGSGLTRDGVLVYGRDSHPFDIFIYADLDCDVKERAVALLLGLALVSPHCGDRAGETVRSDCVSELFAEGFADGFLRGDACDVTELEIALRMSANVRSRVKAVLAGGNKVSAQTRVVAADSALSDGLNILVAGSCGSGKPVVLHDNVSRLAAHPDSVLSLNGRTVEVYNPDGVPLSTVIDGRGVFLVNERTGESVRVPTRASHVFFVGGDVWFHYPNWGEPDLVFDDGWVERNMFPKCRCCGVPVDIDGEACDACEDECLDW
jgi:hypothetical protein